MLGWGIQVVGLGPAGRKGPEGAWVRRTLSRAQQLPGPGPEVQLSGLQPRASL